MKIEKFLDASVVFNLFIAHDEVIGDIQSRLASDGLHLLEALIITGLFFEERQMRPSELATTFRASRSNMSHALRGLEKKGLIERKTSTEDARAYFFNLTKDGKKQAAKLIKVFDATQDHFDKAFVSKKINQSLRAFRKVYETVRYPKN